MADQPDKTAPENSIAAVHLLRCISRSVSTDGKAVMFVMEIAPSETDPDGPTQLGLTMPVTAVAPFLGMIRDMRDAIEKAGMHSGMVHFWRPKGYTVGHSDQMRGNTVIQFDPGMESEHSFLLADPDAFKLGEQVQANVLARMTPAERHQQMTAAKPIIPGIPRGRLILPNGYRGGSK